MSPIRSTVLRLTLILVGGLTAPVTDAIAAGTVNIWTNAVGNRQWNFPLNWSGNSAPGLAHSAQFDGGTGATNAPGLVNNIVAADTTVQEAFYYPVIPAYHTTLINPGVTLSVQDAPAVATQVFGLRGGTLPNTTLMQSTIRGAGRLVVGQTNSPGTLSLLRINAAAYASGIYWATLDMSGLDYFECGVGEIRVGGSGSSAGTQGTWIMARTNLVVVGSTAANTGFTLGQTTTTKDYPSAGDVQLGQANVFRLHTLRVGGLRATNASLGGPGGGIGGASLAGAGGAMEFQTGLSNPTLTVRGINGSTAANTIAIGDNMNAGAAQSTNTATGVLDLTGGTVDVLALNVVVGRNNIDATTTRTGGGKGTLTWTAGTINATTVNIGLQAANNAGSATGTVNVRSNAVLLAGSINLGGDAGTAGGTGVGSLNIAHGGTVTVAGGVTENNAGGISGSSTINLTNGTLTAGGNVTVDTLNYSGGTISSGGALGLTNLAVRAPATAFTVRAGQSLSPGAVGIADKLTVSSGLVLSNATLKFDLSSVPAGRDQLAVTGNLTLAGNNFVDFNITPPLTNGNYLLATCGSFAGNAAGLRVAGPSADGPYAFAFTNVGASLLVQVSSNYVAPHSNLLAHVVGGAVELSWHSTLKGWLLECQTNSLAVGLSTNWFPVTASFLTNRLFMPVDPAAGTVFYRLAYAPSMKELRKAAANRQRRLIFNNDGNEPVKDLTEITAENLLIQRTTGLENTLVDSIFYCPWSSGFSVFTYFTAIGSVMTSTNDPYPNNRMSELLTAGIDPLRVMVEYGRTNGVEIFCSFRMNDTHDASTANYGPVLLGINQLKQAHPEYLIATAATDPPYGAWTAVDYARPEIRDLMFRFAEEVCTNYDVDGIELDFFRHPVFFKSAATGSSATVAERAAMTELMQRIRTMADDVGRARGRPILIAMRVPDSVAYCRAIGLELDTWLATDLLDLLVVSSYFKLNDWDYSVALAHQYGVKFYPSLDESRISDATAQALRRTDLAYRGRAANVWGFGADGVYMFNFTDRLSPLWQQLGSTQTLATLDKDYFGTIRGAVNAAGGNLPYASYQTIEKLNPSNTKTVTPGSTVTSRINVGEDLSQAGPVNLKFRLQFSTAVNPSNLTVTCNSQPLTFTGTNLLWVEYSAATSVVQQVTNHVRVTLAPSASQVVWRDLMLQVRH